MYTVIVDELEDLLKSLDYNAETSPYEIQISGLTNENLGPATTEGTVGYLLNKYGRYVSLDEPKGCITATDISNAFYNVFTLKNFSGDLSSVTTAVNAFYQTDMITFDGNFPNLVDATDMFVKCEYLVKVSMYNTYNLKITSGMFSRCSNLSTISINLINSTDTSYLFSGCTSLKSISGLLSCKNVTNASNMFSGCTGLKTIDTSAFTNVISASSMFSGCTGLKTINTSAFTNVTSASSMFSGCTGLTSIDTSAFENVTNTSYMFYNCTGLTSIDTSAFENVTNTSYMFYNCTGLTSIDASIFTKSTNAKYMFYSCTNLQTIDIASFQNVTDASYMFANCEKLNSIKTLIFNNVTNATNMFSGCKENLTSIDLSTFQNLVTANCMFDGCSSLKSVVMPISTKVKNAYCMFRDCSSLTDINTTSLKTINMSFQMFYNCSSLITIDLLTFNNVSDISNMFNGCTNLTSITNWNFSTSTTITNCLKNCTSLTSITVTPPDWDTPENFTLVEMNVEDDALQVKTRMIGDLDDEGNQNVYTATIDASSELDIKLEGQLDEVAAASTDSLSDEVVDKFFDYRYAWSNDDSKLLDPSDPSFVLWAKDADKVKSNITLDNLKVTPMTSGMDLDECTEVSKYSTSATAIANSLVNAPSTISSAGEAYLTVDYVTVGGSTYCKQILTLTSSGVLVGIYERVKTGSAWVAWNEIVTASTGTANKAAKITGLNSSVKWYSWSETGAGFFTIPYEGQDITTYKLPESYVEVYVYRPAQSRGTAYAIVWNNGTSQKTVYINTLHDDAGSDAWSGWTQIDANKANKVTVKSTVSATSAITYYAITGIITTSYDNTFLIQTRAGETLLLSAGHGDNATVSFPLITRLSNRYTKIMGATYSGTTLYLKVAAYDHSLIISQLTGNSDASISVSTTTESTYSAGTALEIVEVTNANFIAPSYKYSLTCDSVTTNTVKYIKIATIKYGDEGTIKVKLSGNNFGDQVTINYASGNSSSPVVFGWTGMVTNSITGVVVVPNSSYNGDWVLYLKVTQYTTLAVYAALVSGGAATIALSETTASPGGTTLGIARGVFSNQNIYGNLSGNATNVSGTVAVAHGGTGSTTAAGARTNLGLGTMATETASNYVKTSTDQTIAGAKTFSGTLVIPVSPSTTPTTKGAIWVV